MTKTLNELCNKLQQAYSQHRFQKRFLSWYDWKIWVDCSFETGLKRAIARNAENLDKEAIISDYNTYYYPAQHLHFKNDNPILSADIVFDNG